MRQFFINSLDKIITVFLALGCLGVLLSGLTMMMQNGFVAGLMVLIGGGLYIVLMGGFCYLFIGIHENTRRTAEAVEKLVARG
uniref:hypothetical protein n=1 Tax=Paenirhodobacter enshiensis TaxID=1105367 RepID=UPI0035B4A491